VTLVTMPSVPSDPTSARSGRSPGVGRLASELYELPLWSDQVEPGYVVSGEPVLEAVSTAGVLGDVAPIEQTCWLDGSGA